MKNLKKLLLLVIVGVAFLGVPNVFAVDITGCSAVLEGVKIDVKLANTVAIIITAIKIAVPVLLVVFGMLDLLKGVMAQKEDEIKKGQQIFIKRLIAAVIVFFVVIVVDLVISLVANTDNTDAGIMDCASCFIKGADKKSGECNK